MTTNRPRFVVDTNFVVSAVLLKESPARRALDKARQQGDLLQSTATLDKLTSVLHRTKFDKYITLNERLQFLAHLLRESTLIEITKSIRVCRDPKDDKFLELAVDGEANYILTGDDDLLTLHPFQNISIISPSTFLNN